MPPRDCFLFDIDGTLADCSHRVHLAKAKDWRGFFAAVGGDKPIEHMVTLLRELENTDKGILFVSGRSDECRGETIEWLWRNVSSIAWPLYMRRAGDHRPDNVVKRELLTQIRTDGWQPIMAFDDRDQVVKMWRSEGVPCAQVAEGDF